MAESCSGCQQSSMNCPQATRRCGNGSRHSNSPDRKIIGEDIKDVEFSWPIGMPLCRALGRGLWEVRSQITDGRIARVLFGVNDGRMVLLHGFIRKTQKTPANDLDLARKRMREVI